MKTPICCPLTHRFKTVSVEMGQNQWARIRQVCPEGRELAIDGRVRYTKMVIRQSFLSLLQEQSVDKITVSDICRLAEINRATFYRHYENQYGILYELEFDLLGQVQLPQGGESMKETLNAAFYGLREKKEDWMRFLASNADPGLPAKLYRFLEERLPLQNDDKTHRFLLYESACHPVRRQAA